MNPAAMRARERRMEILRKYAGQQPSPYIKEQIKEAKERQNALEKAPEQTAQVQNTSQRDQEEQALSH